MTNTSNLDANLCREHLARLMCEETELLKRLASLLDEEFTHLNGNDVEAIERAGSARQDCVAELLRIEEERRSLCRMSGNDTDAKGLEALLKWCDPGGTLSAHWARCADYAKRCRERNDRNGMVVAARLRRIEGLLNIITGRHQSPITYGPAGAHALGATGRIISGAA